MMTLLNHVMSCYAMFFFGFFCMRAAEWITDKHSATLLVPKQRRQAGISLHYCVIWQPDALHVFISLRYMPFPVVPGVVDNAGFVRGTV